MRKIRINKKGQIDIAIVIGSIIIPVAALIGALIFAWLLISPVTDLCRVAETISYDVVSLLDVVYSVPDDLTIRYEGPIDCDFYSMETLPIIVRLSKVTAAQFTIRLSSRAGYCDDFSSCGETYSTEPPCSANGLCDWTGTSCDYSNSCRNSYNIPSDCNANTLCSWVNADPEPAEICTYVVCDNDWYEGDFGSATFVADTDAGGNFHFFINKQGTYEPITGGVFELSGKYYTITGTDLVSDQFVILVDMLISEPAGFPLPDNTWYRGDSPVGTVAVDTEPGGANWYAVDTAGDGTYAVRGLRDNGVFRIGDIEYTVIPPNPSRTQMTFYVDVLNYCSDLDECDHYTISSSCVNELCEWDGTECKNIRTCEITYDYQEECNANELCSWIGRPIKRDILACMNRNLFMRHFELEQQTYNTTFTGTTSGPFQYSSLSNIPANIYDTLSEKWSTMPFKFRSYANPSDASLARQGDSVILTVDEGIFISKKRAAYYDTLYQNPEYTDAIVKIVNIALQACREKAGGTNENLLLPPQYKLNSTATEICLWWKSLPDGLWHKDYCLDFNTEVRTKWADCSYSLDPVAINFFDDTKPVIFKLTTTYSGGVVSITGEKT